MDAVAVGAEQSELAAAVVEGLAQPPPPARGKRASPLRAERDVLLEETPRGRRTAPPRRPRTGRSRPGAAQVPDDPLVDAPPSPSPSPSPPPSPGQRGAEQRRKRSVAATARFTLDNDDEVLETPPFAALAAALAAVEEHHDSAAGEPLANELVATVRREVARLAPSGYLHRVPARPLGQLLDVLSTTMQESSRLAVDADGGSVAEDAGTVLCSVEAAIAAGLLLGAPKMPRELLREEVIERIAMLARYQLMHTVFPTYDPDRAAEVAEPAATAKERGGAATVPSAAKKRRMSSIARTKAVHVPRALVEVYHGLCALMEVLAALLELPNLTDAIVLELSHVGIVPFFAPGALHQLQHSALDVARKVMSQYPTRRQVVVDEVVSSMGKLASEGKRCVRSFRLGTGRDIQMVSALLVQLVQSSAAEARTVRAAASTGEGEGETAGGTVAQARALTVVRNGHRATLEVAGIFLDSLLARAAQKKDGAEFRTVLKEVTDDLLAALFQPEWPAAEVVVHALVPRLFAALKPEQAPATQALALELLGLIAAALRRHQVTAKADAAQDAPDATAGRDALWAFAEIDDAGDGDAGLRTARDFWLGQWATDEAAADDSAAAAALLQRYMDLGAAVPAAPDRADAKRAAYALAEVRPLARRGYAAIERAILDALTNSTIPRMRAGGLKALRDIVREDAAVLGLRSVRAALAARLSDRQISVREAALELVGQFVMKQPEITEHYYETITRCLSDTGASVRKQAIRVLRDICLAQPEYARVPDICIQLLRRRETEADLVLKLFRELWLARPGDNESGVQRRLRSILRVLEAGRGGARTERWLADLFSTLIGTDESGDALHAAQQLADALVARSVRLSVAGADQRGAMGTRLTLAALSCFCTAEPRLLAAHGPRLLPHLRPPVEGAIGPNRMYALYHAGQLMARLLPALSQPSDAFLRDLELTLIAVIGSSRFAYPVLDAYGKCLQQSCEHSGNIALARDALEKCYDNLKQAADAGEAVAPAVLRHSLCMAGILARYFDFEPDQPAAPRGRDGQDPPLLPTSIRDVVYTVLVKYAGDESEGDARVRTLALQAVGNLLLQHGALMERTDLRELYAARLDAAVTEPELGQQVLANVRSVLAGEAEAKAAAQAAQAAAQAAGRREVEQISAIGDDDFGVTGALVAALFSKVLAATAAPAEAVRREALHVVGAVLREGFVVPMDCVPHLVALSTDAARDIRDQAQAQLRDIDTQFPSMVEERALDGLRRAYALNEALGLAGRAGATKGANGVCGAVLGPLYALLSGHHGKRDVRRAFVDAAIRTFEPSVGASVGELRFIAANLCYFPYQSQDEPLYIVHRIGMVAAVDGSELEAKFKGLLGYSAVETLAEDESAEQVLARVGGRVSPELAAVCEHAQALGLLLQVKQFLQLSCGLTERRCEEYHPRDSLKTVARVSRRACAEFAPTTPLGAAGHEGVLPDQAAAQYVLFRDMMLTGLYGDLTEREAEEGEDMTVGDPLLGADTPEAKKKKRKSPGKRKAPAKRKPKRRKRFGEEDSGDSDGNDWQ